MRSRAICRVSSIIAAPRRVVPVPATPSPGFLTRLRLPAQPACSTRSCTATPFAINSGVSVLDQFYTRGLAQAEFEEADKDHDGYLSQQEFEEWRVKHKPSVGIARQMPREFWQLSNDVLVIMAARGVHGAQRERMVREVMAVDNVTWDVAITKLQEMESHVRRGQKVLQMPYYGGVFIAVTLGTVCLPMIFDRETAQRFNEVYVTTDLPPPEDLETPLEVSIWTWNWMEPMIGTASFLLLVLQFSRAQMINIGWQPYGSRVFMRQLSRLKQRYPQYSSMILEDFLASI